MLDEFYIVVGKAAGLWKTTINAFPDYEEVSSVDDAARECILASSAT